MQSWNKALLIVIALLTLTFPACKPNETEQYNQRFPGLPEEDRKIVSQLQDDSNTKAFIDELYRLPRDLQVSEGVLDYLKAVAADKKVADDELPPIKTAAEISKVFNYSISGSAKKINATAVLSSPNARNAYNSLKACSDKTRNDILEFGLDGDVPAWVALNLSLPRDVADYNFLTKSGIQDKKLTDLEKDFLKDKKKYNQQMLDYYVSEIAKVDPELANKFKALPYAKNPDVGITEAAEDLAWLAGNPQNRSKLEKLYGKGIERKMWPIALERVVYKAFNSEFDVANPLEGQDGNISARLAEFQEGYNTEMDVEGVGGKKPDIRGINLMHEPLGNPMIDYNGKPKSDDDLRFDYALIKWALRCNSVRLYGRDKSEYDVSYHVKLAQNEGMNVRLSYTPLFTTPNIDFGTYKKQLSDFAKEAQKNNVKILEVGNEIEKWGNQMPSRDKLSTTIDELVSVARQSFSGQITYTDYWAWDPVNYPQSLDIISINMYPDMRASFGSGYIEQMKKKYAPRKVVISEIGALTISDAMAAGADGRWTMRPGIRADQAEQAKVLNWELSQIFGAPDGIFVFDWDAPIDHPWGDMNSLSFSIWDYIKKEPKPGFWAVYKYYKE